MMRTRAHLEQFLVSLQIILIFAVGVVALACIIATLIGLFWFFGVAF